MSYRVLTLLALAAACGLLSHHSAHAYDHTVLITGSNRGIGAAMSKILADEGNHVLMTCRNPDLCYKAVLKLREEVGHDAGFLEFPFTIDVTNTSSISHAVADVEEYYPDEIDVLINNAGIFIERYENRSEWTEADFNATLETNFKGAVEMTLALVPYMKPNGTVLMVSSGFSRRRYLVDDFYLDCVNSATTLKELWEGCKVFRPASPMAGEEGPAYKISKVMLNKATELLANDPLLTRRNITINAGNPGTTRTRMAPTATKTPAEGAQSLLWLVREYFRTRRGISNGGHYDQDESVLEW